MKGFKSKEEVFIYLKKKFSKESKLILLRGSTATKPAKKFSDFDIEVYGNKSKKPSYELAFLKEKPILLSVYFYKYSEGEKIQKPLNVKIIFGRYTDKIKPNFSKDTYTDKEKIRRECQLVIDFLFKYLRCGDKKYLESVQKRLK